MEGIAKLTLGKGSKEESPQQRGVLTCLNTRGSLSQSGLSQRGYGQLFKDLPETKPEQFEGTGAVGTGVPPPATTSTTE